MLLMTSDYMLILYLKHRKNSPLRVDFTTTFGELLIIRKPLPLLRNCWSTGSSSRTAEGMESDEYKKLGEQVIRENADEISAGTDAGEQV